MAELTESLIARAYYSVKPFVPRTLRWALRRQRAEGIRKRRHGSWPIQESAGVKPADWPGWPEGHQFAFVVTHDVEGPAGVAQTRQLAELDRRADLRSSFNFIPAGGYSVDRELRNWLLTEGFEVGVHDLHHNGKLYRSRSRFRDHAKEINRYLREWGAVGFRSGFMLRQLDWLHDLDIVYDASTFDTDPFEPQSDGCGRIFPFWVQGRGLAGESRYVELPYTLPQDSTLFLLLGESTPEIWIRKLDWIAERGGMALVNIHPDYVDFGTGTSQPFRYPAGLIEQMYDHLNRQYAGRFWNPLARELAEWFGSRDRAHAGVSSGELRHP